VHGGIILAEFGSQLVNTTAIIRNNDIHAECGIALLGLNGNSQVTGNDIAGAKTYGIWADSDITRSFTTMGWPNFPPYNKIYIDQNNATISRNKIHMEGNLPSLGFNPSFPFDHFKTSKAIVLSGSNNEISSNIIAGESDYGIYVWSLPGITLEGHPLRHIEEYFAYLGYPSGIVPPDYSPTSTSEHNRFHGNNLTGLTTYQDKALYVFDVGCDNNTVQGYTGGKNYEVTDKGQNNSITGVK
jgi:hypothetical protein